MRPAHRLLGETLTSEADHVEAKEIRLAWYKLAHGQDKNIADPQIRSTLTEASWSDSNFAMQLVGIKRCIRASRERGVAFEYGWAASRNAYDFTSEPVYQYALFSALLGIWIATEESQRRPSEFERIVVRQTHGWSVNGSRAEPMAFDHPATRCGWIKIPFVWDDLLQLALEAWLKCLGIDRTSSLDAACEQAAKVDPSSIDWSPAYPFWNGLVARAIAGKLDPPAPHKIEAGLAVHLCAQIPRLQPFVPHQTDPKPFDLGNTLAYLAKVFTVGHEAAHIIFKRRGATFSSLAEEELAADAEAMGALWNDEIAIGSEVREGQSQDMLWVASGLTFFFGLLVFANLNRVLATEGSPEFERDNFQASMLVERLRTWSILVTKLAECHDGGVEGELTRTAKRVGTLIPSMFAFCNALLDYGRVTTPPAHREASRLWETIEPHLTPEQRW
jgi:hypothetical protein